MNLQSPSFTVVLPVHNGIKYIRSCVESVLLQRNGNLKMEVLENCSTDGTTDYLDSIRDDRVRIWKSRRLLSIEENWHRILEVPKNEFMTMIGHDDILGPDFLEEIASLILKHPAAKLYFTHFQIINKNGATIRYCRPIPEIEIAGDFLASRLALIRDSYGTGYVMRSADYQKAGGIPRFKKLLFADDALWVKIMEGGYKVTSARDCFSYRYHLESTTESRATGDILQALTQYLEYLRSQCRVEGLRDVFQRYGGEYLKHHVGQEAILRTALWTERLDLLSHVAGEISGRYEGGMAAPARSLDRPQRSRDRLFRIGKLLLSYVIPHALALRLKKRWTR